MPRFSANLTFLFNEIDFLERFDSAAAAGFGTVEFMFPYAFSRETIIDRLHHSGVTLDLFNLPAGDFDAGERGTATKIERRGEFQDGVDMALRYASGSGTTKLNCLVGKVDPGQGWHDQYRCLVENLKWAAARLATADTTLLIEPLNPIDNPDFFLTTLPLAERIMDDVGAPNLRLQFDVYHVQRTQGDVVSALSRLVDRIGHVQVADSPTRGEPGTGELNFGYILTELDRLGYEGHVGLEYRPSHTTSATFGWIHANGWQTNG